MTTTVITGAASGIGAAIKAQLESQGHTVIGVDRQQADVVADLSSAEGRQAAVTAVLEQSNGQVDGLICCAGVGVTAPRYDIITEVNYFGSVDLIEGLLPALSQSAQPAITVIGSVAANQQIASPDALSQALLASDNDAIATALKDIQGPHIAYSASKYALTAYCRKQAIKLGKQGIRINVIAPGAVSTPLHQASLDDPRFGQAVKSFVAPLGEHTQPDQIANAISFLQSSNASFITGSVLFVDGGMDAMVRPANF